ncbi:MAG: VWA domain-containing protein [Methanosarcinaceae archaeon]
MNFKGISRTHRLSWCLFVIIFGLYLAPLTAQDKLIIKVTNIDTRGDLSLRGLTSNFPFPILTTISVIDSQSNYIPGLADSLKWLRVNDLAENGQLISDIWRSLIENHRDNPGYPADQDIYNQFASPLFTEIRSSASEATNTMLVLDVSTSMDEEFENAKEAARTYVNLMRDTDQAGIVLFSGSVVKFVEMTYDNLPKIFFNPCFISVNPWLNINETPQYYEHRIMSTDEKNKNG